MCPTFNVLSKSKKIIRVFHLKIDMFYVGKYHSILQRHVILMGYLMLLTTYFFQSFVTHKAIFAFEFILVKR